MEPCPLPETLGAYIERRLPAPETEEAEAHLAACPACRDAVLLLSRLRASPAARFGWPAAAAALLLLALSVAWTRRDRPAPPASAPVPSGDTTLLVGRATSVTLRAGSRWEGLRLLEGAAWIEDPGEPLSILVPGGAVQLTRASLRIEVLPAKAAVWIRDAWAADASVRIWVRDGSAELKRPDGSIEKLLPSPAPGGWTGETGWRRGPPAAEPYVWEALLRRKDPSASVSLRFPAGGRLWEVPLGAPLLEAKDLLRVRAEAGSGRIRVRAGAYTLLDAPVASLEDRMRPVDGMPGLRTLGGIEVLEERAR